MPAVPASVRALIFPLLLLVPVAACGADHAIAPPGGVPEYGIIHVDMAMQGDRVYPDSVLVTVDSGAPLEVPSNGSREVHNLPAGMHTISVSDVPDDGASGSAMTSDVPVTGGQATTVSFVFSCVEPVVPPTGVIAFARSTLNTGNHLWKVNMAADPRYRECARE